MALSLLHDDEFFNAMDRMLSTPPLWRGYRSPLVRQNAFPLDFVEHEDRYEVVCECPGFTL